MSFSIKKPTPNATVAAEKLTIEVVDEDQAGSATAIAPATGSPGMDSDGWIDIRAFTQVYATGAAAGAQVTFTAEVKATPNADAIALALDDGVIAAAGSEVIIDQTVRAGFIRFKQAGTSDPGTNTFDLYITCK